jgi:hypothetical protein
MECGRAGDPQGCLPTMATATDTGSAAEPIMRAWLGIYRASLAD